MSDIVDWLRVVSDSYGMGRCEEALEEIERLREALAFYADRATYEGTWDAQFRMTVYPINNDVGKRARAILSKHKDQA